VNKDPKSFAAALSLLADATITYLKSQHQSGAHMVQLFDTWIAEMPESFYTEYYHPLLTRIFDALKAAGIPSIYFTKGSSHLLSRFASLSATGLSVDNTITLKEAEKLTEGHFFLQGNLDPEILKTKDEATVRLETRKLVQLARELKKPAIMNLGHGILPGTPLENAKAFVQEARSLWI
jgi:uroporphyrinogen decarboxylase